MRGPRSRVGLILVFVLVTLPSAPAGAQESPSPAASPEASPATSLSPEASALAAEAEAIVAEVFAQTADSPEEAAAAARATELERSGLAAIDPELPAVLAELEAAAAEEFATFLAEAPGLPDEASASQSSLDPSPGPEAAASAEPSPEAGSSAFLAAVAPGPRDDDLRFAQGGSYLSSIGQVIAYASRLVADFKPGKEGGATPAQPFISGGSRYSIASASDGDTLTLIIELTEQYTVPGATPDSPGFEVTDRGSTTLQIDTCPDEDGTITVTANSSGTYDVVGEGLAYHASLDTNDHATATVNDQAEISGRQHTLAVRGSALGDRPAFAGGAGAVDSQLGATLIWSGEAGSGVAPSVTLDTAEGVDARDLRSAFTGGAFTAALVDAAIDAAERVWQAKRCLELEVEPPGKEVDPGSETEITVKIKHKAFDEEVERDVRATLVGTEEVDPLDTPVRAPADFTYTAGDEPEGEGTITFKSVSNRGIAERTETYIVALRLLLDVDGKVAFSKRGASGNGTLKGRGLQVRLVSGAEDAPPDVTVEGDVSLKVSTRSLGGCVGNGRDRVAVDPAVNASATIVGDGEDRRLRIHIRPQNPAQRFTSKVRCPGGQAQASTPAKPWFPPIEGGAAVEIPLTGGSAEYSGNIQGADWNLAFTLRREQPPS